MTNPETFKHLQCQQLQETISTAPIVVVDIRDENSYLAGHIPGAIHLTNDNIGDFMREADLDVATVVCCYHGISSQPAAEFLISQDFSEVYSLDGGFVQWQTQYPELIES
ncbi:thiosulfate sulfurtransferase GlpE [Thalassotalea atypica]|uniref:thiosulfate sulfurtransferase GlpE n=1 Tax=Thalassotalea atypica TaxID=2054316 RepID=UPI0025741B92|nr:thiosulfate sulfurtransferase GlpE [Thalassotalea atypica]